VSVLAGNHCDYRKSSRKHREQRGDGYLVSDIYGGADSRTNGATNGTTVGETVGYICTDYLDYHYLPKLENQEN
jgi:hypothetical protein